MRKILYHGNCRDGFCAAWVLRQKYPDADFIPVHHDDSPPPEDLEGKDVIIVDFSYDRETLLDLFEKTESLLVLDHHKDRAEELAGLDFCIYNMEESGATLAWKLVHPYNPKRDNPPDLVSFAKDRDLWLWELPNSEAVNAAIASYPMDFEAYDKLNDTPLYYLIKEGEAILRYRDQLIQGILYTKVEVEIDGIKGAAVNSPVLQSEVGNILAQEYPYGIAWSQNEEHRRYSIRSQMDKGGIDVSEIAHRFGGGGHPSASGWRLPIKAMKEINSEENT